MTKPSERLGYGPSLPLRIALDAAPDPRPIKRPQGTAPLKKPLSSTPLKDYDNYDKDDNDDHDFGERADQNLPLEFLRMTLTEEDFNRFLALLKSDKAAGVSGPNTPEPALGEDAKIRAVVSRAVTSIHERTAARFAARYPNAPGVLPEYR